MKRKEPLQNLAKKMLKIMQDVNHIEETGSRSFYQHENGTIPNLRAIFSAALRRHGVFMFSSVLDSTPIRHHEEMVHMAPKLQVTFVDTESGEQFDETFFMNKTNIFSQDKSVYQKMTNAQQYALMKTFLVEASHAPKHLVKKSYCKNDLSLHCNKKQFLNKKPGEKIC